MFDAINIVNKYLEEQKGYKLAEMINWDAREVPEWLLLEL